jgi:serine/threonine protein kinase
MSERILAGRYRLEERIGEGGMGSVYRALDLRTGQDVAVKLLRRKLCEREHSRRRFAREARAAGLLDHPGIVRILDHGQDDRPFLVMELLEGISLRRHVRRAKPSPAELLELMAQIADAMSHAHSRGIIHRDLKPDNVYVAPDGRVKVLDFGLARMLRIPELSALTRSGTALGTCSYMAPEQAAGKEADERSDLYAVGVMLYEFLCGMVPFSADEPASVLYMQVHQAPEPPRAVNPDLPCDVENLILCLMDKDPARRPASARILAMEMRRIAARLRGEILPAPVAAGSVESAESTLIFTANRLPSPALPTVRPAPGSPFSEGDRVCLLTADLPGLSRLGLDRSPLEVSAMMADLSGELEEALRAHSGRLLERHGTRIVAAFAGREPGLRAVQAVGRMRARVQSLLRRYALTPPPALSAGIFGGSLPPRAPGDSWEEMARKELMHGAQRLEMLAREHPDATLICAESLDDRVPVQPLRTLFVRGRRDPVQIFRVVDA